MNTNTFLLPLRQKKIFKLNSNRSIVELSIESKRKSNRENCSITITNRRIKTTAKILLDEVRINTGTIWAFTNHESNERETYGRDITSERNKPIVDQRRGPVPKLTSNYTVHVNMFPSRSPPRNWDSSIDDAELRKQERNGTEGWNPKCATRELPSLR